MRLSWLLCAFLSMLFLSTVVSAQTQPEVFDVNVYEGIYPDIFNAYRNNTSGATSNWTSTGLPAGRRASIIFDPVYYVSTNGLNLSYPAALNHFLQTGLPQGLRGSLEFDVQYYFNHNQQELAAAGVTTFTGAADYFLNTGLKYKGEQGSADFSIQNYMALYPDVAVAYQDQNKYQNAMLHWLRRGKGQGRTGTGTFTVSSECTAPSVTNPRIYIGITGPFGTDSNNTAAAPLDGSTAVKFDTILRTRSESGVQNLIVCLQGGTFQTNGAGDFNFYGPTNSPHHTNICPPNTTCMCPDDIHQCPAGFSVNTNWHIHGLGISGATPTTLQLQNALESITDWSYGTDTGLGIVFLNHDQSVSGVEISDLIIDLNYLGVKQNNPAFINLLAIRLDTHLGNHHLHHLNILGLSGEATQTKDPRLNTLPNTPELLEGLPVFVASLSNSSPLTNSGNLIEYVLMSDNSQTGHCSGVNMPSSNPPLAFGRCTGIAIDNAAAEVRYNVVNGIENGIGGFFMPLVWFHDNFLFNNQGQGYITDSLVNRDVLIQFNEIRNPGTNGIDIGQSVGTFEDFQLQYNTIYLDRDGTTGIRFNGDVTNASVINNNIIEDVSLSSGNGIFFSQTGNGNNQFEYNQVNSGLTNSHTGTDCLFDNWNQVSFGLSDFADTQSSPCSMPPEPGVITSQIDPITNGLEVYFSGFDQDVRTLTWNSSSLWSANSTDISYPGKIAAMITGGPIANMIDTKQNQPEVNLIGVDEHIYQLSWTAANGWLGQDLTALTTPANASLPLASGGGLTNLMDTIAGQVEVYYVGIDGHIHQFYLTGTAPNFVWHAFDVSAFTGGTNAMFNSSLFSVVDSLVGAPEVYYVSTDQHIHQLSYNTSTGWHNYDLSSLTGAPAADSGGITALADTLDGAMEVYYVGIDQHIHQLQWSLSTGWRTFDVSAFTGAYPAVAGQGTLVSDINTLTSSLELYYVGTDQHVHEISWSASAGWHPADVTAAAAGAPNIVSGGSVTSLMDNLASAVDVFYVGTDHRVHELQWKPSTGWHDANIQQNN